VDARRLTGLNFDQDAFQNEVVEVMVRQRHDARVTRKKKKSRTDGEDLKISV
jgi:hypothetical protein